MNNITRLVINFLSRAHWVVIGIGALIGALAGVGMVITVCRDGSPLGNLIIFIPSLGLIFLVVWGFLLATKFLLEWAENALFGQTAAVQILAVIGIMLIALIGAVIVGVALGLVMLYKVGERMGIGDKR